MIDLEKRKGHSIDLVKRPLAPVQHNPDVLTCLANLSNDEVFTPPRIANAMLDLLPQELFSNPQAKFLDPVTKSGVFLREITKRLMHGLAGQIPDMQKRLDHILHEQVFGIAITELTSLIARRTLYCAKYANSPVSISKFDNVTGNIRYKNIRHTFKNGKCVYCGASQGQYDRSEGLDHHAYEFIHTDRPEEIFGGMKFDVIIGNPPYQLSTADSSKQAIPLYNKFIEQTLKLNPDYTVMIIPARWFSGGMGLTGFREMMKANNTLEKIVFFPKSRECFSGVDIAGGVCYFNLNKNFDGISEFTSIINGKSNANMRKLSEFDIIIGDNIGVDIIHKTRHYANKFMDDVVLPLSPFGLPTSARGKPRVFPGACKLMSSEGISYIPESAILKNNDLIDNYKVIIGQLNPDRGGVNNAKDGKMNVITKIKLLEPHEIPTATYIVVNTFKKKENAVNLISYLSTKFARYLISLTLSSMHIVKSSFQFVPIQDFSKPWTDAELYAKYNLTQSEIDYIESMIRPMDMPDSGKGKP